MTLHVGYAVQRSAPLHLATLCSLRCRAMPGFAVKQCRGSFGTAAQVPATRCALPRREAVTQSSC